MITLENICKEFKNGEETIQVLNHIDLHVKKGTVTAIMGKSGCGKTTLLNIIGGLITPTSGNVFIDGMPVNYQKSKDLYDLRRKSIGYVVQNFALISQKTVLENVLLPIQKEHHIRNKRQYAENLLAEMGIADKRNKYPSQISNGERQRTAIARALVGHKQIILADEPTGALDYANAEQVITLLKTLVKEQNITVLLATHDREIAAKCDRILQISYGKIVEENVTHVPY